MRQWPFTHTIEMTYRLTEGVLEVATTIANLGDKRSGKTLRSCSGPSLAVANVDVFASWKPTPDETRSHHGVYPGPWVDVVNARGVDAVSLSHGRVLPRITSTRRQRRQRRAHHHRRVGRRRLAVDRQRAAVPLHSPQRQHRPRRRLRLHPQVPEESASVPRLRRFADSARRDRADCCSFCDR